MFCNGNGDVDFFSFCLLQGLTDLNIMNIGGIVGLAYCSWAIGNFYGKTKILNYAKAFFAYILGMITFIFLATALGILIDIISKQ